MDSDSFVEPESSEQGRAGGLPAANRVLYIEPFSGVSGDMFVGALLDLGLSLESLERKLSRLPLRGYSLSVRRCSRAGIQAAKFDVECGEPSTHEGHHSHHHRSFRDIKQMIEDSGLSAWVKERSLDAFHRLARAEGKVHNQPPEDVHFHEVGAVDSIIDIVGAMLALEELWPLRILSGPVNLGQGVLECQHGLYPAPGPATVELLKGLPTYSSAIVGELTTPTGAAIIASLVEAFEPCPLMRSTATGYGAGSRLIEGAANVLRITQGELINWGDSSTAEGVAVIEANIDDMNPQICSYFVEKALSEGALDVWVTPIQMKKNRPAIKITIICQAARRDYFAGLFFSETTTIGIRSSFAERKTLEREFQTVGTEYGPVRIKISSFEGRRTNYAPEYEDCRRLAEAKGVALKEVLAAAESSYLRGQP